MVFELAIYDFMIFLGLPKDLNMKHWKRNCCGNYDVAVMQIEALKLWSLGQAYSKNEEIFIGRERNYNVAVTQIEA